MSRGRWNQTTRWVVTIALAVFMPCLLPAQVELRGTSVSMTGVLGTAYSGQYGNTQQSSHGLGFTGAGNIQGSYYNPKFLNFSIMPRYNRTGASSTLQSADSDKGVTAIATFLGGSVMPLTVSYGKMFNEFSQFGMPGGLGLTTASSKSQNLGIGWSLLLPDRPSLRVNYNAASDTADVLGSSSGTTSRSKSLDLSSDYTLWGFSMGGGYSRGGQSTEYPEFLTGSTLESNGNNSMMTFSASHAIPLRGSANGNWTRTKYQFNDDAPTTSTSMSAGVGISPFGSLSLNGTVNHFDNAFAMVARSASGVGVALGDQHSISTMYMGNASYVFFRRIMVGAFGNYRQQSIFGQEYAEGRYGLRASYAGQKAFLGIFRLGFSYSEQASESQNHNGTGGFQFDAGLSRNIGKWESSSDFNYSQDVQTALIFRTSSGMTYGTSLTKNFSQRFRLNASFRGSHTGISLSPGASSHAEYLSTNVGYDGYSLSGNYNQSSGISLLTVGGISTADPLVTLVTKDFIISEGSGYNFTGSKVFRKRLGIFGSYNWMMNQTEMQQRVSQNHGNSYGYQLQYKVRKLRFAGAFRRYEQVVSSPGATPKVVNSFSIEITRWFNVF